MRDEILKQNVDKIEPWPEFLDVASFKDVTHHFVADPDSASFNHYFGLSSAGYSTIYLSLEYNCLRGHFDDDIFYKIATRVREFPVMVFIVRVDDLPDVITNQTVNGTYSLTLKDDVMMFELTNGSIIPVVSCEILNSHWHGINVFKLMKEKNSISLKYK